MGRAEKATDHHPPFNNCDDARAPRSAARLFEGLSPLVAAKDNVNTEEGKR